MDVSLIYVVTYLVVAVTAFILSVYFFREYRAKKLRASLAWGIGFLAYFPAAIVEVLIATTGEIEVGWGGILFGLAIVTIAVTLFYYGASLLFFGPGSPFRERMAVLIFIIYVVYSAVIVSILPLEGFRDAVVPFTSGGLIFPVFIVVSALFYRVSGRIPHDDPRRRTILLVFTGWFLAAFNHIALAALAISEFSSPILDSTLNIIHALAWILILYGMAYGKVVRT